LHFSVGEVHFLEIERAKPFLLYLLARFEKKERPGTEGKRENSSRESAHSAGRNVSLSVLIFFLEGFWNGDLREISIDPTRTGEGNQRNFSRVTEIS